MLRELRRAIHLDRNTEAIAEHRPQDVAGDRGSSHAADDHAADVGEVREPTCRRPVRIPLADVRPEGRHRRQHVAGIPATNGPGVVEVDRHFLALGLGAGFAPAPPPGFSASSISITGIPSRTGYR